MLSAVKLTHTEPARTAADASAKIIGIIYGTNLERERYLHPIYL